MMIKENYDKEKYFYSNDLNFVAACVVKGIELKDYYKEDNITTFVLNSPKKCTELEKQWINNQLEGSLLEFSQVSKRLKGIVHA